MQDSGLEQRKGILRSRIQELSKELQFHDNAANGLRERLRDLDDDYRDVLDAIREEKKKEEGRK